VRTEEQKKESLEAGAAVVLNQNEEDFEKKLAELAHKKKCTLAFECVCGDMPAKLLKAMPPGASSKEEKKKKKENIWKREKP
jgi:NADPH:quinone reductase-like Zn-dependent oxidoreductase